MEVLRYIEVIAVILAAVAVIAVAVRGFFLVGRWQRLSDQMSQVLEEDVKSTLAEIEQTARRAQDTLSKMDVALIPFGHTARRIEKWTATLATEALVASTLSPALAKVGGWLAGVRKGVTGVLKPK